jgi:hypothetical protein
LTEVSDQRHVRVAGPERPGTYARHGYVDITCDMDIKGDINVRGKSVFDINIAI